MVLPNPAYQVLDSLLHRDQLPPWRKPGFRRKYVKRFLRWQWDAWFGPPVHVERPERLTVIQLSYARVHNIQPILRSLLKASFVDRVVVSNNNPRYRIRDYVSLRDARLELFDQPRRTPAGIRFSLARERPGDYFITVDDDVFLYPAQLKALFLGLLEEPAEVHGLTGENLLPEAEWDGLPRVRERFGWNAGLAGFDGRVDVLNRVYLFTRAHVERMHELAGQLGLEVAQVANGEDLLISASGQGRPRVHDVGALTECLSSNQLGVATWRTRKDFFRERARLFEELRRLRRGEPSGQARASP